MVDGESGEIQAMELAEASVHDSKVVGKIPKEVRNPIAFIVGDGVYDLWEVYEVLQERAQSKG